MKFDQKEVSLIIALIEGKRASDDMLRGFRGMNNAEKARDEFYNALIKKIEVLPLYDIELTNN